MVILLTLGVAAIIYAEINYRSITCTGLVVKLDSENERPLLGKNDINLMVTNEGADYYLDKPLTDISLKKIESRVKRIPLVKSCEAHYDFSGKIIVTDYFSPNLVTAYSGVLGVISSVGGMLSHPAVIAREKGIPCIVQVDGISKIKENDLVEMDGNTGQVKILN